jgi:lipid-A-disaccharide synthase
MKYYLIAGEASGDMHASNLIRAIKKIDTTARFRCFGGDLMKEAGAEVHLHYREMAMMGLVEVIRKYPLIRKHRKACRQDILSYHPDVLILVDYSGFNLPMARFAAENNIRVIYYISPKLWAWAEWRVKTVRKYVQHMFVILPFEVDFYKKHQVEAEYYGNPVLDSIADFDHKYNPANDFRADNHLENKPIIALLAGSRKQEIDALLPEMLDVIPYYPGYQFVIAGAPSILPDFYRNHIEGKPVNVVYNQTYDLLKHSEAAIVTSGTATLETALLKIPEVVVYKTNPVTFFIGNFIVKIRFFSLVNLILDREAVKELLQENLSQDIKKEMDNILFNPGYRSDMLNSFSELHAILGNPGVADRVASRIVQIVNS